MVGFKFVPCAGDFYVWGTWLIFTCGALDWVLRMGHLIDFYVWGTWLIFTCGTLDWFLRVEHLIDFYVWGTWLIFTYGTPDWHLIDFASMKLVDYISGNIICYVRDNLACIAEEGNYWSVQNRYISLTLKIPLHFQIYTVT